MAHNVIIRLADQTISEPCDCGDFDYDHDWLDTPEPSPFELDRPDLDFFDYEPSPYSGDYSEM
jgi:hypothetical protein